MSRQNIQTFLWNVDASFAPFGDSLQEKRCNVKLHTNELTKHIIIMYNVFKLSLANQMPKHGISRKVT